MKNTEKQQKILEIFDIYFKNTRTIKYDKITYKQKKLCVYLIKIIIDVVNPLNEFIVINKSNEKLLIKAKIYFENVMQKTLSDFRSRNIYKSLPEYVKIKLNSIIKKYINSVKFPEIIQNKKNKTEKLNKHKSKKNTKKEYSIIIS